MLGTKRGGQLGYDNQENIGDQSGEMESLSPVNLNGSATSVSAGAYHTCAVMTDGNVKCWGLNEEGQRI